MAARLAVTAVTLQQTDRAVLLRLPHNANREVWIPLSQLDEDPPPPDRRGVVTLPAWLCDREGIDADPEDDDEGDDPIVVFSCRPVARPRPVRKVISPAFGEGVLVDEQPDRVVVDFPAPHGRKTMLRSKVQIV